MPSFVFEYQLRFIYHRYTTSCLALPALGTAPPETVAAVPHQDLILASQRPRCIGRAFAWWRCVVASRQNSHSTNPIHVRLPWPHPVADPRFMLGLYANIMDVPRTGSRGYWEVHRSRVWRREGRQDDQTRSRFRGASTTCEVRPSFWKQICGP